MSLCALQLRTGVTMVQTEGYAALMSGVSATVARGLFYGGVLYATLNSTCGHASIMLTVYTDAVHLCL